MRFRRLYVLLAIFIGTAAVQMAHHLVTLKHRLADWPDLRRYRAANAALGDPAPGVERVVFFGDSITDNWGRGAGRFFPGKPYVNRGIGGETTPQLLLRFRQDVLDLHPAAVVILGGINDIAQNTGPEPVSEVEGNFRSMAELAKAEHVRVVLCSVLPASSMPWQPGIDPRPLVRELNGWLRRYARAEQLVYLDYYPALLGSNEGMRPELAEDKLVHPNSAGYAVMEPLAEKAVEQALAMPRP